MNLPEYLKPGLKGSILGLIGGLLGFVISQGMSYYTFQKGFETNQKVEEIHLARDLVKDFYADNADVFKNIRTAIESCEPLYSGFNKGGKFNNDEINRYLGFFDDLGFYYREGGLDIAVINQLFGAYIIEADEYDEIRKYVSDLQNNAKQKTAFVYFQSLSEALEALPDRKELTELSRRGCSK